MEMFTGLMLLFFLVFLIYTTYRHIQKQAKDDAEHCRQINNRDELLGDAHSRSKQRNNKQNNTALTTAIQPENETWLTVSSAVAILSIAGSLMFIIKIVFDIYYARKKDKREQELHDRSTTL